MTNQGLTKLADMPGWASIKKYLPVPKRAASVKPGVVTSLVEGALGQVRPRDAIGVPTHISYAYKKKSAPKLMQKVKQKFKEMFPGPAPTAYQNRTAATAKITPVTPTVLPNSVSKPINSVPLQQAADEKLLETDRVNNVNRSRRNIGAKVLGAAAVGGAAAVYKNKTDRGY